MKYYGHSYLLIYNNGALHYMKNILETILRVSANSYLGFVLNINF